MIACLLLCAAWSIAAGAADKPPDPAETVEPADSHEPYLPLARTDSPRQTLTSFVRLRDALEKALGAYRESHTAQNADRIAVIGEEMRSLFDFSQVPAAARREVGAETGSYVLDVLGRVGLPDMLGVPDLEAVDASDLTHYSVPETPFRIVRIDSGPQIGEFLFSAETVQTAPRYFRGIESLPLKSSLPIRSWSEEARQITGPMIPVELVDAVPRSMKKPILGTPLWKALMVLVIVVLAVLVLVVLHRLLIRREAAETRPMFWRRALTPLSVLGILLVMWSFITYQINVAGELAWGIDVATNVIGYLALAWALWLVALGLFENFVQRNDSSETLDANMLRLLARIVGVVVVVAVLATGAQAMGLPVVSVLAGLGIGGLAVALAIRPTLENLIGGFILYLDRPIRVGDFCTFGAQSGTVESIGVRSTQVRAMNRTLITVPNAQFADMQIINWAACDEMMIEQTIGLRYETDADQLRYVLAKIREMFHAHPRIASESIRVRFAGYGQSSVDVLIRVYARTREWNDFFAIQEDVLFRIKLIVEQSGTCFAFPSQTLYLGRDTGLDAAMGEKATQEVAAWRRSGRLPFPRFPAGVLERLAGTLHYPPRGSPDFHATEEELAQAGDEPLSAPPEREATPKQEPAEQAPTKDPAKQDGAKQDATRTGGPERA